MRLQTAYLRDALQLGICNVPDVIQWADQEIARLDEPPYELIELSMLVKANPHDVLSKLRELGEGIPVLETLPALLAAAHQRLQKAPTFGPVLAAGLYQIYVQENYDLPGSLSACGYFDDTYDLARTGTFGTEEEVYQELLEFTAGFAAAANNSFNPTGFSAGAPKAAG